MELVAIPPEGSVWVSCSDALDQASLCEGCEVRSDGAVALAGSLREAGGTGPALVVFVGVIGEH